MQTAGPNAGLKTAATVLYLGYFPVASGTVGSIPGVILFWLLRGHPLFFAGLTLVLLVIGAVAADHMSRKTGQKDPVCVVIDETVGMMVPFVFLEWSWPTAIAAFLAFRFLDVAKPFPVRNLEELEGGAGIMLDDVLAGAYTLIAIRLASTLMPY